MSYMYLASIILIFTCNVTIKNYNQSNEKVFVETT
jgi:hypothetical protein